MIRILIVDSDSSTRAIVRSALSKNLSATITECPDGGAALEVLSRGTFSLLVTELELPMMSGIEMLAIVRHQPRLRDLPIIVLTGKRDAPLVRRVISLGIGDYLVKPVNTERLCARARALAVDIPSPPAAADEAGHEGGRRRPRTERILLPPLP